MAIKTNLKLANIETENNILEPAVEINDEGIKTKKTNMSALQQQVAAKRLLNLNMKLKSGFSSACSDFPLLNYTTVGILTVDMVMPLISAFKRLIAQINNKTIFIPTKQNFCEFIGITSGQYDFLLCKVDIQNNISKQSEISQAMETIQSYLFDMSTTGAEQGLQKERSTIFRMKAKKEGLAVSEVKNEQNIINLIGNNTLELKSPEEYMAALLPNKRRLK
jgi:hypothetical protein